MGRPWMTKERREEARRLKAAGLSTADVAAQLGVCKKTIQRIMRNDSWRLAEHIPPAHRQEHIGRVEALRVEVQDELRRLRGLRKHGGPQS